MKYLFLYLSLILYCVPFFAAETSTLLFTVSFDYREEGIFPMDHPLANLDPGSYRIVCENVSCFSSFWANELLSDPNLVGSNLTYNDGLGVVFDGLSYYHPSARSFTVTSQFPLGTGFFTTNFDLEYFSPCTVKIPSVCSGTIYLYKISDDGTGGGDTGGGDTGGGDTGGGDTGGGDTGGGDTGGGDTGGGDTNPDYPEVYLPDPPAAPSINSETANTVTGVIRDLGSIEVNVPSEGTFTYPVWEIATPSAGSFTLDFGEGLKVAAVNQAMSKLSSFVKAICYFFITLFYFIKVFHLFRKNS